MALRWSRCPRRWAVLPRTSSPSKDWLAGRLTWAHLNPRVRDAKARLILLALSRGVPLGDTALPPLAETFPYLRVGDGFAETAIDQAMSHIVLNPPYAKVMAPTDCPWSSGKVSQAALFLDR